MKIVITGFMGCGKTRIARQLAERLSLPMIDLDEQITLTHERSPAELIKQDGEAAFRAIESQALRSVLKNTANAVIALGGGAWIQRKNRALISEYSCLTVWLDAPFQLCWSRIEASNDDRPLAKTKAQARELYNRRRSIYKLAKIHVEVPVNMEQLISRIQRKFAADERG